MFATVIATPSYDMGTNDRYTTPGTYIIQNTDKLVTNSSYHRDYTRGGKTGSLGECRTLRAGTARTARATSAYC